MKILTTYFWLRTSQASKKTGLAPIMFRLSFDTDDRADINTKVKVSVENWDANSKKVINEIDASVKNADLLRIKNEIEVINTERKVLKKIRTAIILKDIYEGKGEFREWTILELIDDHNEVYRKGIVAQLKGHSERTLGKYMAMRRVLVEFMQQKYKSSDLYAAQLDYNFAVLFVEYLLTDCALSYESA